MTAMEFSRLQDTYPVILISCTRRHTQLLQSIAAHYPDHRCQLVTLPLPFRFKHLNFKKKVYPALQETLPKARPYLRNAKAIIATSHALGKRSRKLKLDHPALIYQYHGCGDRRYSFDPGMDRFDLLLIPGPYYRQRLVKEGVVSEAKIRIVGYPKFDYPVPAHNLKKPLFKERRPIVIYTPHWKPKLSSYPRWGKEILEYFYHSADYNLIFAPHIQLQHWQFRHGYDLDLEPYKADHIHIDLGSIHSIDTTYLRMADIYLGDVSSMVYEFLALQPRPAIFLNPHQIDWQGNVNFRFWELGPVINEFAKLPDVLSEMKGQNPYQALQYQRVPEYIDLQDTPSSLRAAKAIYQFINEGR